MHSQPALTSNSLSTSNSSISTITLPASSSEAKMQYNDDTADIAHRYITTCNAQSTSIDIEFTIDIEFIDFDNHCQHHRAKRRCNTTTLLTLHIDISQRAMHCQPA